MTIPFRWRWAVASTKPTGGPTPNELQYPLTAEIKIAVIKLAVEVPEPGRHFAHLDARQLTQFQPETVAAPLGELRLLAQLQSAGWVRLESLIYPIVVFSSPQTGLLGHTERNELWRAFEVPVFEQLRDDEGQLMAAECEAHDGLHIVDSHLCAGWDRTNAPCACGLSTPRIAPTGSLRHVLAAKAGAR